MNRTRIFCFVATLTSPLLSKNGIVYFPLKVTYKVKKGSMYDHYFTRMVMFRSGGLTSARCNIFSDFCNVTRTCSDLGWHIKNMHLIFKRIVLCLVRMKFLLTICIHL